MGPLRAVKCSVVTWEPTVQKHRLCVRPNTAALLAREEGGKDSEGGEVPSLKPDPWAWSVPLAALAEPQLCYILDAILFLYGIVLTLLYCRLKVRLAGGAGWLPGQRRGEGGAEGCP